jgi:hypothetical protein
MVRAVLADRSAGTVGSAMQISSTLRSQTLVRGESLLRLAPEGVLTDSDSVLNIDHSVVYT